MSNSPAQKKPSCEQLINMLPDPFVVIDRNYKIIAANKHYLSHYGYSHDVDVIGKTCHEISHHSHEPCSQHGEQCPLEEVFENGQTAQVMHVHYDKLGQEERVQLTSNPLFDDEGNVLYVGENIYPIPKVGEKPLIIGRSRPILRMISVLQRVAPTQTSVLLLGESGAGKECVSQYVHQHSLRAEMPLVIVDCGTLGESLIESELFGYEKGAFTGASTRKKGMFEAADGGTLFIDEIAELPISLQTKLLRVLESGTIRRIGGTQYINVDVRIIAATNRNLQKMVEDGGFRQDLYYRLSAFPVNIPPLRDRLDDIPAIAEHFLSHMEEGDRYIPLSPEVIEALIGYDYPGNVRELRNIIERAAILAYGEGIMRPEHLIFETQSQIEEQEKTQQQKTTVPQHSLLVRRSGRLQEDDVLQALEEHGGHRARAAESLGVSERTLYRYVQRMRKK